MRPLLAAVPFVLVVPLSYGCGGPDGEVAPDASDAGTQPVDATDAEIDAALTEPPADSCGKLVPKSTSPIGRRCGLSAAMQDYCSGSLAPLGYLYECESENGEARRPDSVCRVLDQPTQGITRLVCETAVCTPFEDARCGSRKGYACPRPFDNLDNPPLPHDQCTYLLDENGTRVYWRLVDATGPLVCCE